MGFLKSIAKVVTAPLTVTNKVIGEAVGAVAPAVGFGDQGQKLEGILNAPYDVLQRGKSFGEVLPNIKAGISAASTLLTDPSGMTALTSFLSPSSSSNTAPVPSTTNPYAYTAPSAGPESTSYVDQSAKNKQLLMIGAAGFGLLLVVLATRRK